MEKNKKSIRYSNLGIWGFILGISLLSIIIYLYLNISIEETDTYRQAAGLADTFYSKVSSSLYDDDILAQSGEFKYCVRSFKITNYPFTKEYREKYPTSVVTRDADGEYTYRPLEDYEDGEKDKNIREDSNIKSIEEPVYKIGYLSNGGRFGNSDPQSVDFPSGNITFRGFYEDGNISITQTDIPQNEFAENIANQFSRSLKSAYREIDQQTTGIKKLNFAYSFDPEARFIKQAVIEYDFMQNYISKMVIAGLIGLALIFIFAAASDYERAGEVGFYKGIIKYPLGIVFLAIGAWAAVFTAWTQLIYIDEFMDYRYIISYASMFLLMVTGSIAVIYFVYAIKSIYNEGFNSKVIKNSITYRILKGIKNLFMEKASNLSVNNEAFDSSYMRKYYLIIAGFIALGLVACLVVVYPYLSTVVFILWVCLVAAIFIYFRNHLFSIEEIRKVTENMSGGDYTYKISESNKFPAIRDNVNTISKNLNLAVENAVKSERLKTELITNVSHDLKTPLTSIINYSELITDENTDSKDIKDYAQIINEKSHKLKDIIEDLFEISKAASNNIELEYENLDLKSLVSQVVGEWEDKLEEKGLELLVSLPENPVIVNLDGTKTSRVLDNLFSNIEKYALDNTRVYIDLKVDKDIDLTIKNISKYQLNISPEELIERFTRGDSSRNTQGSGLGLSIASTLISAQGGKFFLEVDGDLFKTKIKFNKSEENKIL
ncbi:sensor histidine kinase [Peptoniphilus catoniae]|uniref:sensor histidine kinase n=1 Tax=Peptoniphilus catoniae TaxID=1660341 RepID=UPI0010FCEEF0|nr:HAMP domain-containing sensor histidine kinase [Peptoniphilus catoniae]